MGYEVIYHYQDKIEGKFSEEIKNFKKRVGDPYEEFPLEKLSGIICCQLARRDIYVKDIEIYEITKKKIKFKETKNGIILKNKKYVFDENFKPIFSSEIEDENENQTTQKQITTSDKTPEIARSINIDEAVDTTRPIKKMTFVPEPPQQIDLLKRGIKLTPEKDYFIYKIENHPNNINEIYTILDDKNKTQKLSDLYFVPVSTLNFGEEQTPGLSEDGLNWNGVIGDNIPQIRK